MSLSRADTMAVTGVMVMGRRGGANPHPATEPSPASSRFTPPASPKPSTLTRGTTDSNCCGRSLVAPPSLGLRGETCRHCPAQ